MTALFASVSESLTDLILRRQGLRPHGASSLPTVFVRLDGGRLDRSVKVSVKVFQTEWSIAERAACRQRLMKRRARVEAIGCIVLLAWDGKNGNVFHWLIPSEDAASYP
jgi:hypothetical protein